MNSLLRLQVLLAIIALLPAGVCRGQEGAAGVSSHAAWMADAYWKDGKAEFNVYGGTLSRYGQAQPAEVWHILVREDFAPGGALVKADDWRQPGAYPVLKLNQILRVPTGVYVYQQMHSAFWRVGDGRLVKWSLTSNDSCGNTFKLAERREGEGGGWDYRFFTYWENMTEGRETVREPAWAAVFYDELPAWVRGLDFSGGTGSVTVQLAPGVIGSKRDQIRFAPATVSFRAVDGAGGGIVVTVQHAGGRDELTLDAAFPHRLREWRMADGGALTLKRSLKLPYWNYNHAGDRERAFNDPALRLFEGK